MSLRDEDLLRSVAGGELTSRKYHESYAYIIERPLVWIFSAVIIESKLASCYWKTSLPQRVIIYVGL